MNYLLSIVILEDWPESAKESNSADSWADFTSMKADDWPPLDARPNDGWNDEAVWREQIPEADTVLSPTTTAIVGGIATALIAGTSARQESFQYLFIEFIVAVCSSSPLQNNFHKVGLTCSALVMMQIY